MLAASAKDHLQANINYKSLVCLCAIQNCRKVSHSIYTCLCFVCIIVINIIWFRLSKIYRIIICFVVFLLSIRNHSTHRQAICRTLQCILENWRIHAGRSHLHSRHVPWCIELRSRIGTIVSYAYSYIHRSYLIVCATKYHNITPGASSLSLQARSAMFRACNRNFIHIKLRDVFMHPFPKFQWQFNISQKYGFILSIHAVVSDNIWC